MDTIQTNDFLETLRKILQSAVGIAIVILIATIVKLIIVYLINRIFKKKTGNNPLKVKRYNHFKKLTFTLLNVIYVVILGIIILDMTGLNNILTALITFAGVGSLVIGLAAQNIFKDVIAGFILITEDKLSHDDYVKIDDIEGTVEEIKIRNVHIRTYEGQLVIIPCGQISVITNYARGNAKAICNVMLPYSDNIDEVRETALKAARKLKEDNSAILSEPVIVGVTELLGNGYKFRVYVETEGLEYWAVQRLLNEYIVNELQQNNLQVIVPQKIVVEN